MMEKLEDKCRWYDISRNQRKDEVARGDGIKGTSAYRERGCYVCDGFNKACEGYYVRRKNK